MTALTHWKERTGSWSALGKVKISLFAAASTAIGSLLASPRIMSRGLVCALGTFVLACGAGALNEFQERDIDSRLERTKRRPLPSGSIPPRQALRVAVVLIGLGLLILGWSSSTALLLGAAAVAWYNGVYTGLKKVSAFAAVPGALTGAIPPVMGWVSGGGRLGDIGCLALGLFFFMWQVPHFWLVVLDRGNEYRGAGLPSLGDILSDLQIRRVVSLWILGTAACSILVFPASVVSLPAARYVLLLLSLGLAGLGFRFYWAKSGPGSVLFRQMNLYLASVFITICLGRFLAGLGL